MATLQSQKSMALHASMPQNQQESTTPMQLTMDEIKAEAKRIVPPLTPDSWKGNQGKVGILGGCKEYTGAPFFVAMAALKVGADLAHVFTSKGAAPTVKAYSPEIIVHPYFSESTDFKPGELTAVQSAQVIREGVAEVEAWFSRLDCLVVGPGLGRDPLLLEVARACIARARVAGLPLLLDGDALFLVAREPELVRGYTACILTPNLNEFRRLATTLGIPLHGPQNDRIKKLGDMAQKLAGPVVVSKGPSDALHDGYMAVVCSAMSGMRRCGGQGDILSGAIATFVSWVLSFLERQKAAGENANTLEINPLILASFGGCLTTRTACAIAFSKKRRAMLSCDILEQLGTSVDELFDHHQGSGGTTADGFKAGNAVSLP